MNKTQEALQAVKIRIAFIGHPNEPKDWSKEVALIEAAILESEPEPGEFTEELRKICEEEKLDPEPFLQIELVLEACDRIDRLSIKREHLLEKAALSEKEIDRLNAELSFTKQELGAANLEIKTLKNKLTYVRKRYPEINTMEQALKGYKAGQVSKE